MKLFKKSFIIMITAILFMVLSVGSAYAGNGNNGKGKALGHLKGNVNIFINFSDVKGHWAEDSIALMTAEGVIKGYSDNSFKTEKPVTREEAITMIMRMLGVEGSDINDAYLPSDFKKSWAKDYLALAAQKGILTKEDFGKSFNKPAERCEVATWLVRALGMEDEGLVGGKDLVFKDESAIPDWARNSVRVAARYGIIEGYPNHVFQPRNPIKRAEMAAVMARVRQGFCHEIHAPQLDFTFVRGDIAEVNDGSSPSLTIDRDGCLSDFEVPLMDQTLVYLDGKSADLEDLDEGYTVFVLLDSDGYAIAIMARSGEYDDDLDDGDVSGIFRLIDDDEIYVWVDGETVRFILDDDVEVEIDGEEADLNDLKKGFDVVLEIEDGLVTEIKAESGYKEVTGTFRTIDDDDIIYVIVNGDTIRYRLDDDVEVIIDGEEADLEDLMYGYEVVLTVEDEVAVKIEADSSIEEVTGVFRGLRDDTIYIVVDRLTTGYDLADDVEVIINGDEGEIDDLKAGDEVTIYVEEDAGEVIKIEARVVVID